MQRHPLKQLPLLRSVWAVILACLGSTCLAHDKPTAELNVDDYAAACGVEIVQNDALIQVTWPLETDRRGQIVFDLHDDRPALGLFNHRQGHQVPAVAERRIYDWIETYIAPPRD